MAVYTIQGQLPQDTGHPLCPEAPALNLLRVSDVSEESGVGSGTTGARHSDFLYGRRSAAALASASHHPAELALGEN